MFVCQEFEIKAEHDKQSQNVLFNFIKQNTITNK